MVYVLQLTCSDLIREDKAVVDELRIEVETAGHDHFSSSVVNACYRSPSRSTLLQSVCKISGTLGVFCHCCKER